MPKSDFDVERFIIEVEIRPAIWDITTNEYSDKNIRRKSWEELVDIFIESDCDDNGKIEFGKSLQKRWKNIRDSYTREERRLKSIRSGFAADRKSPYIYSQQLSFLKKVTTSISNAGCSTLETEGSTVEDCAEGLFSIEETCLRKMGAKHRREEDIDIAAVLKSLLERGTKHEADEDRHFLLSLTSHLKNVPEHRKMQTKVDILNAILINSDPDNKIENFKRCRCDIIAK